MNTDSRGYAYLRGFNTRKTTVTNPYAEGSVLGNAWQAGLDDGHDQRREARRSAREDRIRTAGKALGLVTT